MNSQQLLSFLPFILIFVVFYFMLIRPQSKERKHRAKMLSALVKGDKVITIGGLHGSIVDINEKRVTLKVNDNSRLVFERTAINTVISKDLDSKEEVKKEQKPDKKENESELIEGKS